MWAHMGQLVFTFTSIFLHPRARGEEYTGDGTESPPFVMNQSSSILVPEFMELTKGSVRCNFYSDGW